MSAVFCRMRCDFAATSCTAASPCGTPLVWSQEHFDCSITALAAARWPLRLRNDKSKRQREALVIPYTSAGPRTAFFFFFQSLFDTAPAAGAGTATTAVTFPADSSLPTFRRFPLLPDHILPHGGGGDILQWGRVFFRGPNCCRRKALRLQLWSKGLESRDDEACLILFFFYSLSLPPLRGCSVLQSLLFSCVSLVVTEQTSTCCRPVTAVCSNGTTNWWKRFKLV